MLINKNFIYSMNELGNKKETTTNSMHIKGTINKYK